MSNNANNEFLVMVEQAVAAKIQIIDDLTSDRADAALSANMGRVLNEQAQAQAADISSNSAQITEQGAKIAENIQDIALLGDKAQTNAEGITSLTDRITENEKQIQDSQLKDLIVNVEEYPPVSGTYRADATSTEIEQAVNQGRTAYIKFDNLVYNFVEMDSQRVAKFRWVDIQSERLGKRELNVDFAANVEKVDLLYNGQTKMRIIEQSRKVVEIEPNTLNKWGEIDNLAISFEEITDQSVNLFVVQFTSGNVPTTLLFDPSVKWGEGCGEIVIKQNTTYEINIRKDGADYLAMWEAFA